MTFLCFYAASMVFDDELNEIKLIADRTRPSSALYSVLIGVAIGIPLATVNLLGSVDLSRLALSNPLSSAVRALTLQSPRKWSFGSLSTRCASTWSEATCGVRRSAYCAWYC